MYIDTYKKHIPTNMLVLSCYIILHFPSTSVVAIQVQANKGISNVDFQGIAIFSQAYDRLAQQNIPDLPVIAVHEDSIMESSPD